MGDLTTNFDRADFQCRCARCKTDSQRPGTKMEAVLALQDLRNLLRQPIVVTCGVRCASSNQALGGASDSRHLPKHADAIDIAYQSSEEAYQLLRRVMFQNEFSFVEVADKHIHLDMRPGPKRLIVGMSK